MGAQCSLRAEFDDLAADVRALRREVDALVADAARVRAAAGPPPPPERCESPSPALRRRRPMMWPSARYVPTSEDEDSFGD